MTLATSQIWDFQDPLKSSFQISFRDTPSTYYLLWDQQTYQVKLWSNLNLRNYGITQIWDKMSFFPIFEGYPYLNCEFLLWLQIRNTQV